LRRASPTGRRAPDDKGDKQLTELRQHVLVWVAPQFLQSTGMLRILKEAEFLSLPEEDWGKFIQAAEEAGGFALGGMLVESNHGAGIWISPQQGRGLELMIPWPFVRSVITAQDPQSPKMFGLMADLSHEPVSGNGAVRDVETRRRE